MLSTGRAGGRVRGFDELVASALATDNLVAEVAGVSEDGSHGGATPDAGRSWMTLRADLSGAGVSLALEDVGDRAVADALVEHLEDASHDRRRVRIGLEGPKSYARGGLVSLGMRRVRVHDPVAVVGATAQPAPGCAVSEHGVARPRLQPAAFRLGEPSEEAHEHLVALAVGVDPATEFGHPELDAVVRELREHELELTAGERSLRLGDDECLPSPSRVRRVREQS